MNSLTLYLILVPVVGFILLLVNILLAKHVPYSEKVTSYECGFSPIYGQNRSPFTIQFYLVGILFLIFDIEIFMTMPYALTVYETGHYGFWIIMVFFGILTLGFVYEYNTSTMTRTRFLESSVLRFSHISYQGIMETVRLELTSAILQRYYNYQLYHVP